MASNSNRKSSSSASSARPTPRRAPKPTPRRAPKPTHRSAGASGARPAPARPVARPVARPAARPVAKPAVKPGPRTQVKPAVKPQPKPTRRGATPRPVPGQVRPAASGPARNAAGFKVVEGSVRGPRPGRSVHPVKPTAPKQPAAKRADGIMSLILKPFVALFGAIGGVLAKLPLPHVGKKAAMAVAATVLTLVLVVVVAVNSPLFAATEVQVNPSEHLPKETVEALVQVPEDATLFNFDREGILESLQASPWVGGIEVEREWPHKLVITPVERQIKAIAYMTADEVAWAIGDDGTWVAPVSLAVAVDERGDEVPLEADGSVPEGAKQLAGLEAALLIAERDGALLLIDVPSDVQPKSGEEVTSEVVLAGLSYAKGFTPEFLKTIKDLSVPSVEAISANLRSGIEVSLGSPEHITEKERVVTKLLEQEEGVTFVNVREPGAYTFRSAP